MTTLRCMMRTLTPIRLVLPVAFLAIAVTLNGSLPAAGAADAAGRSSATPTMQKDSSPGAKPAKASRRSPQQRKAKAAAAAPKSEDARMQEACGEVSRAKASGGARKKAGGEKSLKAGTAAATRKKAA